MQRQLFSMMLGLSLIGGGLSVGPTPLMAAVAQAPQTITVKGQVVDQDGEPLIGATVKVKNSNAGAVTDVDGNFQITAPANAILVVSYVGYQDKEVAARGRAIIESIQLSADETVLD